MNLACNFEGPRVMRSLLQAVVDSCFFPIVYIWISVRLLFFPDKPMKSEAQGRNELQKLREGIIFRVRLVFHLL